MSPDILLVREKNGYRVLHGHLRLTSMLDLFNEAIVDVSGEGKVRIFKTQHGVFVAENGSAGVYPLFNRKERN